MISMASGGDAQSTRFLWGGDRSPIDYVTSPLVFRIPSKEITA